MTTPKYASFMELIFADHEFSTHFCGINFRVFGANPQKLIPLRYYLFAPVKHPSSKNAATLIIATRPYTVFFRVHSKTIKGKSTRCFQRKNLERYQFHRYHNSHIWMWHQTLNHEGEMIVSSYFYLALHIYIY